VSGSLRHMLAIERTLLNIVGRLSGIATLTRQYVESITGTKAVICDTRKTTPGMRNLEKYAVRCGGGTLHRIGLYDAALYKDNHLALIPAAQLAETVAVAAKQARTRNDVRFVEVEVDSLKQFHELLRIEPGVIDIVLLDNMSPSNMREAVKIRDTANPALQLEASGGVNLETVRAIAESGVDRISVGALTHSVTCLDVGLDVRA
jgi:nicotinate-nucleotide pyrophosphorylase (carboxylating)